MFTSEMEAQDPEFNGVTDLHSIPLALQEYVELDFSESWDKHILLCISNYAARENTQYLVRFVDGKLVRKILGTDDKTLLSRTSSEEQEYLLDKIEECTSLMTPEELDKRLNSRGHTSLYYRDLMEYFETDTKLFSIILPSEEVLRAEELEHVKDFLLGGESPTKFLVTKGLVDCITKYGYLPQTVVYSAEEGGFVDAETLGDV